MAHRSPTPERTYPPSPPRGGDGPAPGSDGNGRGRGGPRSGISFALKLGRGIFAYGFWWLRRSLWRLKG